MRVWLITTPAQTVSETEEHAALWRVARQTLKPEAFDAVDEVSGAAEYPEIAGIMNRSETSVKVMLHRARKNLERLESSEAKINPEPEIDNSISTVQQLNYNKGSAPCSA